MSGRGRILDLGLGAMAAATLSLSAWLSPAAAGAGGAVLRPDGQPLGATCPSRLFFSIECPFCGLTRSFVALAHGRPGEAWAHHPAGPLLFAALALLVVAIAATLITRRRPLAERTGFIRAAEAVTLASFALGICNQVFDGWGS
jgi:Protein of unknown function (DUF2752)